jgi:arsenate reductase (thioredoxin)
VLLGGHAAGLVDGRSAGSEPGRELNPSVVAVLAERGLGCEEFPKPRTDEAAREADIVVTTGRGDTCPA